MSGKASAGDSKWGIFKWALFILVGIPTGLMLASFMFGLSLPFFWHAVIHPVKETVTSGPRFADVAAVEEETDHTRQLRTASLDRDEVRSNFSEWPTYRLRNTKAPIFDVTVTDDGKQLSILFMDTKGDWVPVNARRDQKPVYWDPNAQVHADLRTIHTVKGEAGTYVPVAQRATDGLGYHQGWALREDLIIEESPQPWQRSILRTALEDGGNREVVDRYTVVLEPGQTSTVFTYQMPSTSDVEKRNREGWYFNWRIRCDQSMQLMVNGHPYFTTGDTDTTEANNPSGGLALQVTMPLTTPAKQVPVEFIFYWHKNETETATPVAQS